MSQVHLHRTVLSLSRHVSNKVVAQSQILFLLRKPHRRSPNSNPSNNLNNVLHTLGPLAASYSPLPLSFQNLA